MDVFEFRFVEFHGLEISQFHKSQPVNIKENQFKNQDKHEVYVDIVGQDCVKKDWDLDGFILIPDNCDGKIETIYNQYFNNGLIR